MTIQANLRAAYIRAYKARWHARHRCSRLDRRMSEGLQREAELEALDQLGQELRELVRAEQGRSA